MSEEAKRGAADLAGRLEIRAKTEEDPWETVAELLHRAYQEHQEEGRSFAALTQSAEALKKCCGGGLCALAYLDGVLTGTGMLAERGHGRGGYVCRLGVLPEQNGSGIGRALVDWLNAEARRRNYEYLECDTAETARKLVEWYERRGCRRVGYVSHAATNYYSIKFRKYLRGKPPRLLWVRYLASKLLCKTLWRADGKPRWFARPFSRRRRG